MQGGHIGIEFGLKRSDFAVQLGNLLLELTIVIRLMITLRTRSREYHNGHQQQGHQLVHYVFHRLKVLIFILNLIFEPGRVSQYQEQNYIFFRTNKSFYT